MNDIEFLYEYLPFDLCTALKNMDEEAKRSVFELRLRRDKAVILCLNGKCFYLLNNGGLSDCPKENTVLIHECDFDSVFKKLCSYSLYSNADTLRRGYLTLSNGARVGVCLTAVVDEGRVISVKDAVSLNIRIPRQVKGCSNSLCGALFSDGVKSVIVASAVSGGKTTLLRDLARNLSDKMYKVAVVDERNEIGAKKGNVLTADVGDNTDVLTCFPKTAGIEVASRTLSPDVIILDEVSKQSELKAISYAFSCGVKFILSLHAGSIDELRRKKAVAELLSYGEFSYIIFIDKGFKYKICKITDGEFFEDNRCVDDNRLIGNEWDISCDACP